MLDEFRFPDNNPPADLADENPDGAARREFLGKLETSIARWRLRKENHERKLDLRQAKRDMGVGYLIWAARRRTRVSQRDLARRIGVTPSAMSRWESGNRAPSLATLQSIATQTGYELMLGLYDPAQKDIAVLGVLENELPVAELDLIEDRYMTQSPPPRPWRAKLD